jgi:hypothetical protein
MAPIYFDSSRILSSLNDQADCAKETKREWNALLTCFPTSGMGDAFKISWTAVDASRLSG